MNDNTLTVEAIQALDKEFSAYADKKKSPYEIISSKGHHLIDIGRHVEAWLLEKHCFIFEDNEILAIFAHHDKEDHKLIESICSIYHNELSTLRIKH
jgi:hypothetical protein